MNSSSAIFTDDFFAVALAVSGEAGTAIFSSSSNAEDGEGDEDKELPFGWASVEPLLSRRLAAAKPPLFPFSACNFLNLRCFTASSFKRNETRRPFCCKKSLR